MNDFIVTQIERNDRRFLAAAYFEERHLTELTVMPVSEESRVGKIYIGYVESSVKNIGGAFIRISKDFKCFLPNHERGGNGRKKSGNSETGSPVNAPLNTQGHMLVRITKDAAGVKEAVCSATIELSGKYSIVSPGKTSVSFSKKLNEDEKGLLRKWINPHDYPGLHILIRTNAAGAEKKEVLDELNDLSASLNDILRRSENAKPGTCLYSPEPFYISMMRDLYAVPDRAFSDIPAIAKELGTYMKKYSSVGTPVDAAACGSLNPADDKAGGETCLFHPGTLTLAQVYNLEHDTDRLCQKIVWLKSGAYLVIERTEAFVVIDINTGRCTRGRIPEETYRRINLEAGEEIMRQLRLRDLSGMILIDFINLENEDHREELINVMRKRARREHRKTEIIDLTKLGILEMVREKRGKSLEEILFG